MSDGDKIMSELYKVVGILERLLAEHERMLKLAGYKKEVLIKGDMDELACILQVESRCMNTIQSLEQEREQQISLYFMRQGIHKETCYLSELIELADTPELKENLARCQKRLGDVIAELRTLNRLNQQLLQQSLAFINFTLEELTAPEEDPYLYQQKGNHHAGSVRFFDSKA
ncbi:FlgN protein [Aneurinibacillus thermoaerophilus]|uniref:FlgN protein n=2 Tax=Aneurinibacillus thermoaerophilus TaxID=143495 RepID=A0A1G8FB90_ANETH|nr:FlgN protein [Aneurinibacillus thermoaerophilus]